MPESLVNLSINKSNIVIIVIIHEIRTGKVALDVLSARRKAMLHTFILKIMPQVHAHTSGCRCIITDVSLLTCDKVAVGIIALCTKLFSSFKGKNSPSSLSYI